MTLRNGQRVMAKVDYFPPSQIHGFDYWPMAGEEGVIVHREGVGPDGARLYAVRFDDDTEADDDNATWTYSESELEIVT